jgi:hypothetical protein
VLVLLLDLRHDEARGAEIEDEDDDEDEDDEGAV